MNMLLVIKKVVFNISYRDLTIKLKMIFNYFLIKIK